MEFIQNFATESISILESIHVSFTDLFLIALTVLLGKIFLVFLSRAVQRVGNMRHVTAGSEQAILQILSYIVWLVVGIVILNIVGVNLTLLIASSAALLI